jgi:hypothetical protein
MREAMSSPHKLVASALAAFTTALLLAACGGDKEKEFKVKDPNPDNHAFHIGADASRFGGAAPLEVRFFATPYHNDGKVRYRWRFDDGTISEEESPIHKFTRPGYYQVLMEARDKKAQDAWNLILGVWPPKVWEAAKPTGAAANTTLKKIQRAQDRRTGERRREQLEKSKQRAAQYSQPKSTL